jgi:hypothetical protein
MFQHPPQPPQESSGWNYTPPPQQLPVYPMQQPPMYQQPASQQQPMYQPPAYQQPYQPPVQRKARWLPWIITLIIVFFIGVVIGRLLAPSASSPDTASASTPRQSSAPASSQATSAPTQAASAPTQAQQSSQHFKVGQAVQVGNTWQIIVNSVKTSQGDDIDTPKPGDVYLLIDVTMKNISSQEQTASSLFMWTLRDTSGQEYTEAIMASTTSPDGKVEAGSQIRGTLVYEVPASLHAYTLAFDADLMSQGQTIWDISV